jgi:hypothetical protein
VEDGNRPTKETKKYAEKKSVGKVTMEIFLNSKLVFRFDNTLVSS